MENKGGNMKSGKGSIVPKSHSQDKRSQGFSNSGIPSKDNDKFQEGLAQDQMGSSKGGATGPQNVRK